MRGLGVRATNSRRALYNDLKGQDKYAGKIVTPGYLRLEQSVQSTLTNLNIVTGKQIGRAHV